MASSTELAQKKNANAPVWAHFGFRKDEKGEATKLDEPLCRICSKKVAAKDGNTSNLRSHLKNSHPLTFARLDESSRSASSAANISSSGKKNQPGIMGAFGKATKYQRDSAKWRHCTGLVTNHLAKGMVPFITVDKSHFKNMVEGLNPQFECPGRKYFSKKAIPQLYNSVLDDVQKLLTESDHFSLTTDMWSARNMKPYMGITFHTITKEWSFESKCLQTTLFEEAHTAENLSDALESAVVDKWHLDVSKLAAITTDNAANIRLAIRDVLKWPWLNCFGHNLNVAVTHGIGAKTGPTQRAIATCHSITGAFAHSWRRKQELRKKQVELGLPEHQLITVRDSEYALQLKIHRTM